MFVPALVSKVNMALGSKSVTAVRVAFLGSLFLSLLAVLGTASVSRDGAFYLDIARHITSDGLGAGWEMFDWPWFPILLAGTHIVSHLPLEACAYVLGALFMAGTCALTVDCVRQRAPHAAYWACLIVLAMPAVNGFRSEILREHGFWFFCSLALWLALRWQAKGGWLLGSSITLCVAFAALFRLEALAIIPALMVWQAPCLLKRSRFITLAQLSILPVLLATLLGAWLVTAGGGARVAFFIDLILPQNLFASFHQLSRQFGESLINKYSVDDAGLIILFGLSGSLIVKLVSLMGPFALPLLQLRHWQSFRTYWAEFKPFACVAIFYLIVLMMFFIRLQFINGRYLSWLNLLMLPVFALMLSNFSLQFPRLAKGIAALGIILMLANVVSFSPGKSHYPEAGHWVAQHIDPAASVYYEDGRISYYAGRGYVLPTIERDVALSPAMINRYEYFVIDAKESEPWLAEWLSANHQRVLARFANRKRNTVLVIGH